MQNKFLTREIIAHLLALLGAGEFIFGKGLSSPDFYLKK